MAEEGEPAFVDRSTLAGHIYQPIPRRQFSLLADTSDSPPHASAPTTPPHLAGSQSRPSDFLAQLNARLLGAYNARDGDMDENGMGQAPSRNKSLLNMTRGTLFGIYDEDSGAAGEQSISETPWGTGAETPQMKLEPDAWGSGSGLGSHDAGITMKSHARRASTTNNRVHLQQSPLRRQSARANRRGLPYYTLVTAKLAALFLFGVVYGVVVSHLHDSRELAAVRVEGVDSRSWFYLASWGLAGLVLGSLLPYVELAWGGAELREEAQGTENEMDTSLSEQLNDIVRSVGAFMGIAFAIRRLPWQSTLQLTLTLALVNPALWYILDRSKPGLSFSLIVTSILTSFIFLSNPDVLPSPSLPATTNTTHAHSHPPVPGHEEMFAGVVSYETLAVVTWVGSVLFCSCVCFGSIGRRLAVWER